LPYRAWHFLSPLCRAASALPNGLHDPWFFVIPSERGTSAFPHVSFGLPPRHPECILPSECCVILGILYVILSAFPVILSVAKDPEKRVREFASRHCIPVCSALPGASLSFAAPLLCAQKKVPKEKGPHRERQHRWYPRRW
jgi:hypothetical protein